MIVDDIFEVRYGVDLELNALEIDSHGINFVSRTSKNNGVSAKVKIIPDIEPVPAGTISVAGSGSVMESFLQLQPYYSGRDLFYLTPRQHLSNEVLLYYALCLRKNRWKFSYGRQANTTLKTLEVPSIDDVKKIVKSFSIKKYKEKLLENLNFAKRDRDTSVSKGLVELYFVFNVYNGLASSEVKRYEKKIDESFVPYVRPSHRQATSVDAYVSKKEVDAKYIYPRETLYVSTDGQGSHSYSYVSAFEFVPNSNVCILIPNENLTLSEKLFYASCITRNRWLFSYGRKPKGDRLKKLLVPSSAPEYVSDDLILEIFEKTE